MADLGPLTKNKHFQKNVNVIGWGVTLDLVCSFAIAKLRVVKFPGCTVLHWRDRESPVRRMGVIDKLLTCGVFF